MNTTNDLPTLSNQQVYTVRGSYAWRGIVPAFFAVVFLVELVVLGFLKPQNPGTLAFLLIPVLAVLLAVLFMKQNRGLRLILGDEGMIYAGPGYHVYTPWNNIVGRAVWGRGVTAVRLNQAAPDRSLAQGISQGQPAFEKKGWGIYDINAASQIIPIGYFMPTFHDSPVKEAIRAHAPQVFEYQH